MEMARIYDGGPTPLYYIYPGVKIGKDVKIFPYAVVGKPPAVPAGTTTYKPEQESDEETVIGDGCVIGAGAVIYRGCKIGKSTLIGDGARLRDKAVVGNNCIIGMGTKVGPKTIIGNKVKIMDLCNIAGNMLIEDHVFISQGVMCANDKYMGRSDDEEFYGPRIGKWATIGANATILPDVWIGENAVVGAGAIVADNVKFHTVVMSPKAVYVRDLREDEIKGGGDG
jgi:acetyltransferase-like isoleucine patch superfamily enzyme